MSKHLSLSDQTTEFLLYTAPNSAIKVEVLLSNESIWLTQERMAEQFGMRQEPELKGFSDKNLWRMKQFFETYQADEKLLSLVRELPWTHNTIIFSRCKSAEEREYYLNLCIKERYTSRELERQINASHFERAIMGNQKLSAVLRELPPTINNTLKDNYVLEFLGLPMQHDESHLQKALIRNMKKFILELGRDFIFVGEEYRLQVGNQDFFIDLLFFHRGLVERHRFWQEKTT